MPDACRTSRVKLYEMVGATRHTDQRVRALTQQSRRHHYMYSELQGPGMVRRCASFTNVPSFTATKGISTTPSKKLSRGLVQAEESQKVVALHGRTALGKKCCAYKKVRLSSHQTHSSKTSWIQQVGIILRNCEGNCTNNTATA